MTYSNITPDQLFQVINELMKDEAFDELVKLYDIEDEELNDFLEDVFYETTGEMGFTFSGMKKQEAGIFADLVRLFIKSNLELYRK